jgi:hypothetical protein
VKHIAGVGETITAYKIIAGKPGGNNEYFLEYCFNIPTKCTLYVEYIYCIY